MRSGQSFYHAPAAGVTDEDDGGPLVVIFHDSSHLHSPKGWPEPPPPLPAGELLKAYDHRVCADHPFVQAILARAPWLKVPSLDGERLAELSIKWLKETYPDKPFSHVFSDGEPRHLLDYAFKRAVWQLRVAWTNRFRKGDFRVTALRTDMLADGPKAVSPSLLSRLLSNPNMTLNFGEGSFQPKPGYSNLPSYNIVTLWPKEAGTSKQPGRKQDPRWAPVLVRLDALLETDGAPATGDGGQAKLEKWVTEQFEPEDCPAESTIRSRVAAAIAAYRHRVDQGQ